MQKALGARRQFRRCSVPLTDRELSTPAPPSGDNAPIEILSGEVKLNHEFTVTGTASTMLLDFDGDQSVRQTGSGNSNGNGNGRGGSGASNTKYMMTPVIRVISVQ